MLKKLHICTYDRHHNYTIIYHHLVCLSVAANNCIYNEHPLTLHDDKA